MFIDHGRVVTARVENTKSGIEVCWLYHKRIVKTVVTTLRGRIDQSCLDTLGWCFQDSSVCKSEHNTTHVLRAQRCGAVDTVFGASTLERGVNLDTKRRSRCHGVIA
jgi:hypothetical protein